MDEIMVRAAKGDDAASVARVYAPYVRETAVTFELEPPDAPTIARRTTDTLETHPWLVAENTAGEIAGYAYASRHRERPAYRWTIDTTIYVDTAHRRADVGTKLYRSLLEILRGQGFRRRSRKSFCPILTASACTKGWDKKIGIH
jgi:phosphinothricin acetyltransferase